MLIAGVGGSRFALQDPGSIKSGSPPQISRVTPDHWSTRRAEIGMVAPTREGQTRAPGARHSRGQTPKEPSPKSYNPID